MKPRILWRTGVSLAAGWTAVGIRNLCRLSAGGGNDTGEVVSDLVLDAAWIVWSLVLARRARRAMMRGEGARSRGGRSRSGASRRTGKGPPAKIRKTVRTKTGQPGGVFRLVIVEAPKAPKL